MKIVGSKACITFILPVLNRRHCILRAVESCLNCATETVEPHVIVIDGESSDGTFELLNECYQGERRVTVIQNRREDGFMDACFLGVSLLDTEYTTFMYSDDLLSPYFYELIEKMVEQKSVEIALGYGKQVGEGETLNFPVMKTFKIVPADIVFLSYYGRADLLESRALPVNPVCCVVRSQILREWAANVKKFVESNQLRQYSMIQLCGGQDLMIYLTALTSDIDYVLLSGEVVAQLTASRQSITSKGNKEVQLLVGYWLARIWGFNRLLLDKKYPQAGLSGGYILVVWFYIMLQKVARCEWKWTLCIAREVVNVISELVRHGQLFNAFLSATKCIFVRHRIKSYSD